MKILVTGANGQLAQTIQELTPKHLPNFEFVFVSKNSLSITEREQVLKYFEETKFDYCINCAAYTNVEGAETHKELAFEINDLAVQNLIDGSAINNTTFIHISTDYVFDGRTTIPYKETDPVSPLNEYGKSKLEGELRIVNSMKKYFIIRTSWLYSAYGKNFAKTIANKISNNEHLTIITSQKGVPTSCIDLAKFVLELVKTKNELYGTYHFCPNGETTWYGFAKQIASNFPNYSIENLKPVEFFATKAERPLYSVMDNTKASKLQTQRHWTEGVDEIVQILKNSESISKEGNQ